jgi:hypothetical protein
MAIRLASTLRLSGSVRLILAVWRLIADFQQDVGKAVLNILKKQYPGVPVDSSASEIGRKLTLIAENQLQKNPADAQDAIMDFLTYLTTGSKYEMDEEGKVVYEEDPDDPESSHPKERTVAKPWDFAKDFKNPNDALRAIYTNLKRRSIDKSKTKARRRQQEESVDDAFGTRGEGGGPADGGEARMPTPDSTSLGKALDDKAAIRQFIEVIDKHIGDLRESLPLEQQVLFDLVFEDEVGSFGSDVKANMGQAPALKDKLTGEGSTPEMQALYEKNAKRWSGFVSNTRTKLLSSIIEFIENELPQQDIDVLWSEFFSDTTPQAVAKKEQEGAEGKEQYQIDIDTRKLGRLKWKIENGETLSDADQKSYDRLVEKLKKSGVEEKSVEALHPDMKGKKLKKSAGSSVDLSIVHSLSSTRVVPVWFNSVGA